MTSVSPSDKMMKYQPSKMKLIFWVFGNWWNFSTFRYSKLETTLSNIILNHLSHPKNGIIKFYRSALLIIDLRKIYANGIFAEFPVDDEWTSKFEVQTVTRDPWRVPRRDLWKWWSVNPWLKQNDWRCVTELGNIFL